MSAPASSYALTVNFTKFQLEIHVQRALQKAWALAGAKPVNAAHLLKGAILESRSGQSKALLTLAKLLPVPQLVDVTLASLPPADLAAFPVTTALAESFSIAEGFFKDFFKDKDKNTVWGRDFVTLALLAQRDDSLNAIGSEAGVTIDAVRNQWYNFVISGGQRHTRDSWQRWWRAAGVPLPTGEKTASAEGYLFTWDTRQYAFNDLESRIEELLKQHSTVFSWSTGNQRDIKPGARVLLLREGAEGGLVGVGEVQGAVTEAPHWDPAKAKEGLKSQIVDVRWTALSRQPFLHFPALGQQTGNFNIWQSQGGLLLPPDLAQKVEEIWPQAWAEHLRQLQALPEVQARQWIASFNADRGKNDDSLKLEGYINAFARVMASRNLTPPLSIGLFGDWGSGKSFFMDRLYEKIDLLSRKETVNGETPLYWQKICQIRFNAWHYAETNLWASLVSTIFSELRVFLDGPTEDADEFNKLLKKLEVMGELRKEAEQKLKTAEEKHTDARKRVSDAEEQLRKVKPAEITDEKLRAILKKKITEEVKGVDRETIVKLLEQAADWSGRPEFREGAALIGSGSQTVEEGAALLEEARALSTHAGFWWRVLSGAQLYKTTGFWVVIFILLAIPPVAIWASQWLQQAWVTVWGVIAEVLTAAGAIITFMRSRVGGATKVFDRLSSLQGSIARSIEDARNADRMKNEAERDRALAQEKEARAHLEQMRREEQEAAEAEQKAREALRDSTSQARLGRFIRERASSADYEKHLGLIAMIHRDFERLSKLMQMAQEPSSGIAVANALPTPANAAPQDGNPVVQIVDAALQAEIAALPRIDRIILYIDDLDRCYPPEKVVKILEAVHLLLFFPLFVVVVGVDSRWVSRSLHKHYQGMLADEAIGSDHGKRNGEPMPAESQDFLEKIFQVPFWLRRMEPSAVQRLIHSLISHDEVEIPPPPPATPAPPVVVDNAQDASEPEAAGEGGKNLVPSGAATVAESPGRAAAKQITGEAESETFGESLEPPSESLKITLAELAFMNAVAPLMPRTPRSVKRFVNIYRLYKAALSPPAFARFLGTPAKLGNFRSVQVLLALVTGTPRLARKVFEELQLGSETAATKRLSDLAKIGDGEETWQTTIDALREFAQGENNLPLDGLREVAPLVARYSVHHMVSAAPGEAGLG